MALQSSRGPVPKGAIQLSSADALNYQWEQIRNWPDKTDVWPYRYGFSAQAFLSVASATFIHNRFRKAWKLRHYGFAASLLPMVIVPPILSVIFHCQLVSADIILFRRQCPLCLQYRASAIQVACGMVYPLIMSPIANSMFVLHYGTTRIPYWKDFRGHWEMWKKVTMPMSKHLVFFTLAHVLLAGFVTYGEFESLYTIRSKLSKNQNTDKEITQ
ncbi:uncharacterized protein [Venturia canescens]|uniref:uncharacterized protein n=1 Tax=Venturia canescens TaxID=32260 RepID=UPI001C9BC400|nr:uncharacterized protein LOC122410008 [Venturia canescens]